MVGVGALGKWGSFVPKPDMGQEPKRATELSCSCGVFRCCRTLTLKMQSHVVGENGGQE